MAKPSGVMSSPTPVTDGVWMMQWVVPQGWGYSLTMRALFSHGEPLEVADLTERRLTAIGAAR